MKLYSYFRSSAAYRVRIALHLKELPFETIPVHLLQDGGQQHNPDYRRKSPLGTVPALEADGSVLTQSLAIIEFLDEMHPLPPLLPADPLGRARVRGLAQTIACDIHPINNLRVLQYLVKKLSATQEQKDAWYAHWVSEGLAAVERLLADDPRTGRHCHGDAPTLADCCLVPQVFNALRFNVALDAYPTIRRIYETCAALPAFQAAHPARQPDSE